MLSQFASFWYRCHWYINDDNLVEYYNTRGLDHIKYYAHLHTCLYNIIIDVIKSTELGDNFTQLLTFYGAYERYPSHNILANMFRITTDRFNAICTDWYAWIKILGKNGVTTLLKFLQSGNTYSGIDFFVGSTDTTVDFDLVQIWHVDESNPASKVRYN